MQEETDLVVRLAHVLVPREPEVGDLDVAAYRAVRQQDVAYKK